jgi:hypothetical protein
MCMEYRTSEHVGNSVQTAHSTYKTHQPTMRKVSIANKWLEFSLQENHVAKKKSFNKKKKEPIRVHSSAQDDAQKKQCVRQSTRHDAYMRKQRGPHCRGACCRGAYSRATPYARGALIGMIKATRGNCTASETSRSLGARAASGLGQQVKQTLRNK